jgi:hypothetical protein
MFTAITLIGPPNITSGTGRTTKYDQGSRLSYLALDPYPRVETPSLRSRSRACSASGE